MKTDNLLHHRCLLWLWMMILFPFNGLGTPAKLSIESFNIMAGESKEMVIYLTNSDDKITLVQFDLRLPEGLSVKQTGGEYDIDMCDRTTWRKHSLNANATGDIIRFLLASSSNTLISGTEGGIIKVILTADANFKGGTIFHENILLVSPDEKETRQDTYKYVVGSDKPTIDGAYLSIAKGFHITAGETKEMVIELTNPDEKITLVQFDLRLPEGASVKQTGTDYVIDMCERTTWRKHSLDANATNGIIRFLLASSSNTLISGTEGGIIKVTLTADANFKGGTIYLENILLVSPDEKETRQDTYKYVIGSDEPTIDGAYLSIAKGFQITAGETKEMVIELTNPNEEITLVQFDLRLPEGISVEQSGGDYVIDMCDRTNWRKHSLDANSTDGIIRFLLASSSNTLISGTEGGIIKVTLTADKNFNGGTIYLENILLVSPDEQESKPTDVEITVAIKDIMADNVNSSTIFYNFSGQRVGHPRKGLYIQGGKKVLVK